MSLGMHKLELALTEMELEFYEKLKVKLNKIENGEMTLDKYQAEVLNKIFQFKTEIDSKRIHINSQSPARKYEEMKYPLRRELPPDTPF